MNQLKHIFIALLLATPFFSYSNDGTTKKERNYITHGNEEYHNGNYQKALPQTKIYLAEMAYDKIWSELSNKDKEIMMAICNIADKNNGKAKVQVVREKISESGNTFNQYRRRLITAGLLDGSEHGWVYITLPFFEQYVLETYGE